MASKNGSHDGTLYLMCQIIMLNYEKSVQVVCWFVLFLEEL